MSFVKMTVSSAALLAARAAVDAATTKTLSTGVPAGTTPLMFAAFVAAESWAI